MTVENAWLLAFTGVVSFVLSYFGAAAGLILGHLRLPLLVYILKSPVAGASTNLAVSGFGAVAGSWKHVREGRVSRKLLLVMGLPSMLGSALSILFFVSVNPIWSHFVIGAMLLYSGVELVRKRNDKAEGGPGISGRWSLPVEVAIGLALGAMAAATGLMLGTIRLPMMIKWLKVDPKVAVGTNMVVGCLTAFAAAITAWIATWVTGTGGARVLNVPALLIVGPPTILGSYLGARMTGRLSPQTLKGLVGWTVALSGLFMVGQAGQKEVRKALAPAPTLQRPVPEGVSPFDPFEETPDPLEDHDDPDEHEMPMHAQPQEG